MVDETSNEHLDQLCLYLGRVVILCTRLEDDTTTSLAKILGLNDTQERCLVRPMSTTVKVTTLKAIAKKFVIASVRKQIDDIADAVRKAADKRNDLVHGIYAHKNKKVAVISFSGHARFDGNPISWTPKDLAFFCEELKHLSQEVQHLPALFPTPLPIPKT